METSKDLFRLYHIKTSVEKIIEITNSVQTLDNFEQKWLEQDAMIRNFEIIGEASHHISSETKNKYESIEWNEIRGMRNYISHVYFGVDLANVWSTAIDDVPRLKIDIERIISDLKSE